MPENSGPLSITDGRDQAAGSLFGFAGSESFETTAVGPSRLSGRLIEITAIEG
jgi:hypothetical protein